MTLAMITALLAAVTLLSACGTGRGATGADGAGALADATARSQRSYAQANALLEQGRLDEAIRTYDAAIKLDPKNSAAYENRGIAWMKEKDFYKALKDFE
ncbi:MAG: hypothetical protein CMH57_14115, partial [Myxococcales bacterium]|nr:hypothetical protein [Myxococcales bacterium]